MITSILCRGAVTELGLLWTLALSQKTAIFLCLPALSLSRWRKSSMSAASNAYPSLYICRRQPLLSLMAAKTATYFLLLHL